MKYIVYKTTNLINGKIYIGIHKTLNPLKFDGYLGCGVISTQPYTYENAKTKFQCAVKKYGPKNFLRSTLAIFDTEEEASLLEETLVDYKFLQREDVYNMVLGGVYGCPEYLKTRVYRYDLNGNYIEEFESFADASQHLKCDYTLISYAVRKKAKAKDSFWSTIKVDKLDLKDYNKGNNHQIPIFYYNKSGEYLGEFKNQTIASKQLNVSCSSIKDSRLFGTLVDNKYYFCQCRAKSFDIARKLYVDNRIVYKYDYATGRFIQEYSKQSIAEQENKNSNISKSIRLKQPDKNGFIWSLEKMEIFTYKNNKNKKRKVGQYDLDGNLITTYDSASAAAKQNGTSVWKVLNGTNQSHKKHIYKYIS